MKTINDINIASCKEEAEGFNTLEEAKRRAEQLLGLDEAVEQAIADREAEGWECLGVFDIQGFFDGKYEKQEDEWLAAME